jgi:hypothetical protein
LDRGCSLTRTAFIGGVFLRELEPMSRASKYDPELRKRAVRMVFDHEHSVLKLVPLCMRRGAVDRVPVAEALTDVNVPEDDPRNRRAATSTCPVNCLATRPCRSPNATTAHVMDADVIARARQIRLPSSEGAARRHTECHKGAAAEGFMTSRVIFRVFLTSRGVAQPG